MHENSAKAVLPTAVLVGRVSQAERDQAFLELAFESFLALEARVEMTGAQSPLDIPFTPFAVFSKIRKNYFKIGS